MRAIELANHNLNSFSLIRSAIKRQEYYMSIDTYILYRFSQPVKY